MEATGLSSVGSSSVGLSNVVLSDAEMNKQDTITIEVGGRKFILDAKRAHEAFTGKKVVNGRITEGFNILPCRYQWALTLYRKMKANHWEPEDINMDIDIMQWGATPEKGGLNEIQRWIVKMAIGYFSIAEGIVGDNVLHVVREKVTAPELKLVLGRHAHEENVHADSLVYMISSLGLNPHECEAIFENIDSIKDKNNFVTKHSRILRHDIDLNDPSNLQLFAKNIFVYGQCMEGTQFYGLFGMVLSMYRQNKIPGVGQMFRYTLRDESNHIELFCELFNELVRENPQIWTDAFKEDLRETMREAVELEKLFVRDCLPSDSVGLNSDEFCEYVEFVSNRRLESCNLQPLFEHANNPFPWLAELMDIKVRQNFFEGRVTEYQKSSALVMCADDEL
jgi:ribonucleoside-diphosphate reductase beta chain